MWNVNYDWTVVVVAVRLHFRRKNEGCSKHAKGSNQSAIGLPSYSYLESLYTLAKGQEGLQNFKPTFLFWKFTLHSTRPAEDDIPQITFQSHSNRRLSRWTLTVLSQNCRSMASSIEDFEKKFCDIEVILKKYTPASLPARFIDANFSTEEFKDDSQHMQTKCDGLLYPFQASSVTRAPMDDAKVLYNGGTASKKVIELLLNITNVDCRTYSPGDTIGILVSNSRNDVESALLCLQLNDKADSLCEISINNKTTKKNAKLPQHVPQRCSARAILRDCLDLRSIPKKLFLRSLAEYTADEYEQKFLYSVSSKEGSQLYNQMILDRARTFIDILQLCSSCCPPLSLLIEHLPRLKPRPYSIANSPLWDEGRLKIIFSVLPENPGVATEYLMKKAERFMEGLRNAPEISFYFRESNKFHYGEEEASVNNILIGIGCGVSPFLGFLQHKDFLMKPNERGLGSTQLFVGSTCQESAVHRDELLDFKDRGVLQELFESFSRDPECSNFKYVQDQLKANAVKFVSEFSKKGTILYVCADGNKISKSIEDCIKDCLVKVLECTVPEAELVIKESRDSGKYREDIWI